MKVLLLNTSNYFHLKLLINMTSLRDECLLLYLHFLKPYNNQIWSDGKPVCSDFTLKMMLTLPQLDDVTNIYGFLFPSTRPLTNKLGMVVI